jgi:ribosomal protein uL23
MALGCEPIKHKRLHMSEKKVERSGGPSDEQLDKMIDESVAHEKKEPKKTEGKKPEAKKEAEPAAPVAATQVAPITEYDPWGVLMYPNLAEKAMNMVEIENKLVFVVRKNANKDQIKDAVEKGFDVTVLKVNVEVTTKGEKRAYIKLSEKDSAADIASRMGML